MTQPNTPTYPLTDLFGSLMVRRTDLTGTPAPTVTDSAKLDQILAELAAIKEIVGA